MSDITKNALATSLKKLMSKRELSKITIKDITEDSGIQRQTFYYHFVDIYDLIEWIFTNEIIKPIKRESDTYEKWQEGFLSILYYVLENEKFIKNAYNSISRKYVNDFIYKNTYELLKKVVDEEAHEIKVREEDKKFITNFYQAAFVGIIQNWIQNGMKENPNELTEKLNKILDGNFKKALNSLRYDKQ